MKGLGVGIAGTWGQPRQNALNSFFGVKPAHSFDPWAGHWGAWELAVRWSELDIDDDTFNSINGVRFADPSKSASQASSWALGLSGWLNADLKFISNYEQTHFTGGAGTLVNVKDRPTEKVFFTRFQFAF